MQARAPSASARMMSAPVRMPPSNSTSVSPPTASAIAGSAAIDDDAPSSWRPPWFDTTMASAPTFTAVLASSTSRMPLMISLPGQIDLEPLDVLPVQRRIELRLDPVRELS